VEWDSLARRLRSRWILASVCLVNVVGLAYGFFYYVPQFAETPVYLWPLVPDSPMAVLLMTVALAYVACGESKPWLNLLGSGAMIKVGVWTAVVLAWFPDHFGFAFLPDLGCPAGPVFGCGNLNTYLFYLHLGMALEPLLVADQLPTEGPAFLAVGGIFAVHDVLDYAWPIDYLGRGCQGIFPHTLPCETVLGTFAVTLAHSLGALILLYAITRRASPEPG
jgi:uncharacterized membrane protein YpjA